MITTGTVGNANANSGAGGECIVCHSAYFDSHTYDASHSIDMYGDISGGDNCDKCHFEKDDNGTSTWADIKTRHALAIADPPYSVCEVCNDSTQNNADGNVQSVIQTSSATTSCLDCHDSKSSAHGGHPGDWGTTSTCSNASCHTVASASEIMTVIHGNGTTSTCTICHDGGTGDGTARVGDATNGVDGDATIMNTLAGGGAAGYNNTICTYCHDTTDPDVNAGSIGGIHHNNKGSSGVVALTPSTNCTTNCHAGTAEKTQDHSTAITDSGNTCDGCHDSTKGTATSANINSGQAKQHDECDTCHAFDAGWAGILDTPSTNRGVDTMTGGDCTGCHDAPDDWTSMHTPVAGTIHGAAYNNYVTTDAACISCHDISGTSDARSTSATPYIATGTPTDVHYNAGNGCATCHDADGTMKSTDITLAISPVPSAGGSNTCQDCHINGGSLTWTSLHAGSSTVDHATEVAVLASCGNPTVPCHDTTGDIGAPDIATLVSSGDDKLHDTCTSCHDAVGGTINGSATPAGGGAMDTNGGTCDQCHSMAFALHSHHTVANQVAYDVDTDWSQETNDSSKACAECHHDAPPQDNTTFGTLASPDFDAIRYEHDVRDGSQNASGGCETCHDYASDPSEPDDTPLLATVNTVIGTDATAICTSCHVPKLWSEASSTHGGHAAADFEWSVSVGSMDTCGSTANGFGCHVDTTADNVTAAGGVHDGDWASALTNGQCNNCHNQPKNVSPGDGNTGAGENGDASAATPSPANATTHTEVCTDCHTKTSAEIHHDRTEATGGTCVTCHKPNVANAYVDPSTLALAGQGLACNYCHLFWGGGDGAANGYTNSGGKVAVYSLDWDPNANRGTVTDTVNTAAVRTVLPSHTISTFVAASNPATPPISDYAACFSCHAYTAADKGGNFMVTPWHGFAQGYANDKSAASPDNAGAMPQIFNQINIYSGPNRLSAGGSIHTDARHPAWMALGTLIHEDMPLLKAHGSSSTGYDGNGVSPKKIYDADNGSHMQANATYQTNFAVPWDDYDPGTVAAPQDLLIDLGTWHGNVTVPSNMPTVPLSLP